MANLPLKIYALIRTEAVMRIRIRIIKVGFRSVPVPIDRYESGSRTYTVDVQKHAVEKKKIL